MTPSLAARRPNGNDEPPINPARRDKAGLSRVTPRIGMREMPASEQSLYMGKVKPTLFQRLTAFCLIPGVDGLLYPQKPRGSIASPAAI
jgi:hypothetical protein